MKKHGNLILSLLALAVYIVFNFLPATDALSTTSFQVLGIFLATMILWLGVSITWPTLVCPLIFTFSPTAIGTTLGALDGEEAVAFTLYRKLSVLHRIQHLGPLLCPVQLSDMLRTVKDRISEKSSHLAHHTPLCPETSLGICHYAMSVTSDHWHVHGPNRSVCHHASPYCTNF